MTLLPNDPENTILKKLRANDILPPENPSPDTEQ
jgi:hypothetical protein